MTSQMTKDIPIYPMKSLISVVKTLPWMAGILGSHHETENWQFIQKQV
jgi:hypothetical protein